MLKRKWNPLQEGPNLGKIISEHKQIGERINLPEETTLFNPHLEDYLETQHGFRFLAQSDPKKWTSHPMDLKLPNTNTEEWVDAHLGASILEGNGNISCATYGIILKTNPPQRLKGKLPNSLPITHNTAVALGILKALEAVGEGPNIKIHLASKHMADSLTTKLPSFEDANWEFHDVDSELMRNIILRSLRTRKGLTTFKTYDKTEPNPEQPQAQSLAKAARNSEAVNVNDSYFHRSDLLEGAKLSKLTQAQIYRLLLEERAKKTKPRSDTVEHRKVTGQAARARLGYTPDNAVLWKSIRSKHIVPKKVKAFLWKLMHNALPAGKEWGSNPERALCPKYQCTESPSHILTECPATGQKQIWELASELLSAKGLVWPKSPTLGNILSCGLPAKPKASKEENRLLTIVVSESAWLIWALHCRWVIEDEGRTEKEISAQEAKNTWTKMINAKLTLDILASNTRRYKDKSIPLLLVEDTGRGYMG